MSIWSARPAPNAVPLTQSRPLRTAKGPMQLDLAAPFAKLEKSLYEGGGMPVIAQLLEQLRKEDQPETVATLRRKVTIKKVHFLGATGSGIYPRFIQWYGDSVTKTILGY